MVKVIRGTACHCPRERRISLNLKEGTGRRWRRNQTMGNPISPLIWRDARRAINVCLVHLLLFLVPQFFPSFSLSLYIYASLFSACVCVCIISKPVFLCLYGGCYGVSLWPFFFSWDVGTGWFYSLIFASLIFHVLQLEFL